MGPQSILMHALGGFSSSEIAAENSISFKCEFCSHMFAKKGNKYVSICESAIVRDKVLNPHSQIQAAHTLLGTLRKT